MPPLYHLNYPLDTKLFLMMAEEYKIHSKPYYDPRYDATIDFWKQYRVQNKVIEDLMFDLNIKGKPRFYWTEPNTTIPEHVDNKTTCSVNFILTNDPAPVTIEGTDYVYEQCLLNTSLKHSVKNGDEERILLKISIFDTPFEKVIEQIPEKYRV